MAQSVDAVTLHAVANYVMGKTRVIKFMRTEAPCTNTHELDAHMNFMIYGIHFIQLFLLQATSFKVATCIHSHGRSNIIKCITSVCNYM